MEDMATQARSMAIPDSSVLDAWTTIKDARTWAGVTDDEWKKLAEGLGDPEADSLLLHTAVDDEAWVAVRNGAGLPVIRKGAANLLFAAIKAKFGVATAIVAPRQPPEEPPQQ